MASTDDDEGVAAADAYLTRCQQAGAVACGPFAEALAAGGSRRFCKLSPMALTDRDLWCIAGSLRVVTNITALDLSKCMSNRITADSIEALGAALAANSALQTLSLAENPSLGDGAATAVAEALVGARSTRAVDGRLSNHPSRSGSGMTASRTRRACALASLNLSAVGLTIHGVAALSAALARPDCSLTCLYLDSNHLNAPCMTPLAAGLVPGPRPGVGRPGNTGQHCVAVPPSLSEIK